MFKVGDIVQCIDDENLPGHLNAHLKKGDYYTVSTVNGSDWIGIYTFSIPLRSDRFQLVEDQLVRLVSTSVASKDDSAKVDLALIPQIALTEMARAFMVGEIKYGRYNYCKGHKSSKLVAAAMRHLKAWDDGEDYCPKDLQNHLGSVMACCAMILRQIELGTHIDDRYKSEGT